MGFGQFVFTCVKSIFFVTNLFIFVDCFNFDVDNPTIYNGPDDSYFGYTTAILRNKDGTWILVGAPRSVDRYQPFVRRPGALYKCPYPTTDSAGSCTQVNVDSVGETRQHVVYHGRNVTFHHQKEDQWLGVSLDVDPKNHSSVLICAHRWTDSYIQRKMGGITHMNGMCYILGGDLDEEGRPLPALTVTERLVSRQRYAEFSMGSLGMASVITEDQLLMTAPGLNDWSGGLAIEVTAPTTPALNYIEPQRKFHQDSYIGYSMAIGTFVYRNTKCVALGAPRVGKVFVYSLSVTNSPLNTRRPIAVIRGNQIGSYFGASMVSIDVNRDGMDDIIVGAPLFAEGGGIEQGRVFIYISKGIVGFQKSTTKLEGEIKNFARFGTAIAVLGDVNQDGFTDIAVGAPYQDINGAVFIYNGFVNGIYPKYTQLIHGKAVHIGLRGFGISFSRPFDINDDGVNDIAVGAYSSDQVTLFRGRPVVDMKVTYHFYPNQISKNSTCRVIGRTVVCFQVQLCFYFKYNVMTSVSDDKIDLTFKVMADSNRTNLYKRAVMIDISDNRIQHATSFNGNLTLINDEITCSLPKMVYVKESSSVQSLDPIEFETSIEMKNTNCQLCPLLSTFQGGSDSPLEEQKYKGMVTYEEKCSHTEACESILSVSGNVKTSINNTDMSHSTTDYVSLETTITNIGDIASSLTMTQNVSRDLVFQDAVDLETNRSVSCVPYYITYPKNISFHELQCFLGNLRFKRILRISTLFYFKNSSADLFEIKTSLSSSSKIASHSNTSIAVVVPVIRNPSIVFIGVSVPEEHVLHTNSKYKETRRPVSHIYSLYNKGQVSLKVGTVFLYHRACSTLIKVNDIKTRVRGDASIHCIRQDLPFQNNSKLIMSTPSDILLAICLVQNLTPHTVVHINTTIRIGNILDFSKEKWNFTTTARLVVNSGAKAHSKVEMETNVTAIMTVVSWGIIDAPMKYWIVVMSSFCGLMVLLMFSVLLWKCGFFTRKDRDLFKRLVQRRNLLLARYNPSESDTLLNDDSNSETIVMTASSGDSSSETMVMTPPPSYREVNSFCSNSRSSTHTNTTRSSGSEGYLEPFQTTV